MSTKLTQQHLFKGTREFEIAGDQVKVLIKARFKEPRTLSVMLAVLDPEPVITKSHLHFVSRVNAEPLLSLALFKPNATKFNTFVSTLRQKAQAEYNAFSGMTTAPQPTPADDLHAQPPEFGKHSTADIISGKTVNIEGLENAINMLQTYLDQTEIQEIQALLNALTSLRQAPQDHARLVNVAKAFNALGSHQGAVLTYAPYIAILLSDDPFGHSGSSDKSR